MDKYRLSWFRTHQVQSAIASIGVLLLAACQSQGTTTTAGADAGSAAGCTNPPAIQETDVSGLAQGANPTLPMVTHKKFAGQTVIVASETGPPISSPVVKYGPQWEKATGATIKLVTYPFGDMFTKFRSAMATGSYQFDLMNITSGWAGDFMGPGLVQPVPHETLCTLNASNWTKFVAQSAQWNGKFQGVPLKGNTHLLWYRLDLFANAQNQQQFKAKYGYDLAPPKTWNQYYDVCQFFNTFSWNATGKSYGCVETMGRAQGSVYFLIGRAAGYSKVTGDPNFFFDNKTMKPLINNPGWVQALTDFKKDISVGPPGAASFGFADTRPLFEGGNAAITIDWDDPMGLSLLSDSKITGKLGAALVPGGARLYNYNTKQWQDTPQGNTAPFLAVTTWLWTVPKSAKYSEAAWDLVTFLNNQSAHPVLVATPAAAAAPTYDTDYALSEKYFVAEGAVQSNVKSFLDSHKAGVEHPNAVLDLRIPGGGDYYNALDTQFSRAMSGELTPQAALDAAYADWEGITDRLGRDAQLKAYNASLASS